jgi:hypothetical protein
MTLSRSMHMTTYLTLGKQPMNGKVMHKTVKGALDVLIARICAARRARFVQVLDVYSMWT